MYKMIKNYLEISRIFMKSHWRFYDIVFVAANQIFTKTLSFPFFLISHIVLPINWKFYLFLQELNLSIQVKMNYLVRIQRETIETNLTNVLKINNNRNKIAKQALINRNLQSNIYNNLFLKLVNIKQYVAYNRKIKINNFSGMPLERMGIDQKIIFCHAHSNHIILSIVKLYSLSDTTVSTLLIQRGFSKAAYAFLDYISRNLYVGDICYHDPFKDGAVSLAKKVKKSNIIHLFVDLPIHTSLKNFSSTTIELFGKSAIVNNSAAKLAVSFNALCIPVFVCWAMLNIFLKEYNFKKDPYDKTHQ